MSTMRRIAALIPLLALIATCASFAPVRAQETPVKIALITDMSGVYASLTGPGAQTAIQMAIDDFGGKVLGRPITLTVYDHHNKGPEAEREAREFFDGGGDVIIDVTTSPTAFAASTVAKQYHRLVIATGAASSAITGSLCDKYTYHYAYDTYSLAQGTANAIAAKPNGKSWFVLAPDYAFGKAMVADFNPAIERNGGKIVSTNMYPFPSSDYSSYLLAAKNSGASVFAFYGAGNDVVNAMKQFFQFGLEKTMLPALGLVFLPQIDADPDAFANTIITDSWYWNLDKAARDWSDRWSAKMGGGLRPSSVQAADYSATTQWLNAVKAVGSTDGDKLVPYLDGRKFNDFYARNAEWRAGDHRVTHDMYVVQIVPADSLKEAHAWYRVIKVMKGDSAFRPVSAGACKKDW